MNSIVNYNASFSHLVMDPYSHFPHQKLAVLSYKQVLQLGERNENDVKQLFENNGWTNAWTDGIFNYHHYHTTAHEVLAVIAGDCMLELGGPDGTLQKITKGDVIVLPAGVVHRNVGSSADFAVIGAYPNGQEPDMNEGLYERKDELEKVAEKVKAVSLPEKDPVFGDKGPVTEIWLREHTDTVIKKERQF
jgi:uncharacterized protein YjlB